MKAPQRARRSRRSGRRAGVAFGRMTREASGPGDGHDDRPLLLDELSGRLEEFRILWETIGWCGKPPTDTSRSVAAIAIALTVVGWILIPVGVLLTVARF